MPAPGVTQAAPRSPGPVPAAHRARPALRAYPWIVLAVALALGWLALREQAESPAARLEAARAADVEAFTQPGCPHCEGALAFVRDLERTPPGLTLHVWNVVREPAALRRLEDLSEEAGAQVTGTPALRVKSTLIVGWRGEATAAVVRAVLAAPAAGPEVALTEGRCPVELDTDDGTPEESPCTTALADGLGGSIGLPWGGHVDVRDVGLPAFTLLMGLVDGFNPCAMWVLLFVLSLLVHLRSRSKMLAIAGTFVLASGLCYFAFMAAWLSFFDVVGHSRLVQVLLGCLALFVGALHVKDFFVFHEGLTASIPETAKPGIYLRVTRILKADRLAGAMAGVVVLALLVNVVELACTAGLPAIYTHVLAQHDLTRLEHYGYLALYQVTYMLDDALVLLVAVVTLSHARLQRSGALAQADQRARDPGPGQPAALPTRLAGLVRRARVHAPLLSLALVLAALLLGTPRVLVAELPAGVRAPALVALRAPGEAAVDLGTLRGRGVLLVFLSTQCPHCRSSLPRLNALHAAGTGLRVVGACAEDAERVSAFVRERGVRFDLWRVEREALRDYDVRAMPAAFVLSATGRILWGGDPARLDDAALARWCREARPPPAAPAALAFASEGIARDELGLVLERLAAVASAAGGADAAAARDLALWLEDHAALRLAEARADRGAGRLRDAWLGLDALARALPSMRRADGRSGTRCAHVEPGARREIDAGALLEEARALLRAERRADALARLDDLVARHAGTQAAERASALIRRLRRTN
jgi:hypothetical protein